MASLRSFFLGSYYSQVSNRSPGGHKIKGPKQPKGPYLTELLERAGVRTVSLRTLPVLSRARGICRGFGEEEALGRRASASKVVKAILSRLKHDTKGPLFVYAHMLEPHAPYTRGPKSAPAKQRYLAEVSAVDAAIGKLRKALRKRKLHERTYLMVTADHGEAFGEHGRYSHVTTVYEEMIRIPLLIEGPKVVARRAATAVSLMDLGPTILSLFGVATPAHFMAQSLVPFMRGEDPVLSRPLAVESGRRIRAMLFGGRYKTITDAQSGTEELYDLKTDPGERKNLAERPIGKKYLGQMYEFFERIGR